MRTVCAWALLVIGCGAAPPEVDDEPAPIDRDGDELPDDIDTCPCAAEDVDEWQDDDGCPDVDDDGDMIVDPCDVWLREAETWNGIDDGDGCPDAAPSLLRVEIGVIRILETIFFARGSATVSEASLPILDEVAQILVENPQLTLVRILGHADRRERRPEELAARRADAVFEALVARGVDRARLAVESRGTTEPLDERPTEEGRAHNRRVSFDIAAPPPEPSPRIVPSPPPEPPPPLVIPTEPTCPGGALPTSPPPC